GGARPRGAGRRRPRRRRASLRAGPPPPPPADPFAGPRELRHERVDLAEHAIPLLFGEVLPRRRVLVDEQDVLHVGTPHDSTPAAGVSHRVGRSRSTVLDIPTLRTASTHERDEPHGELLPAEGRLDTDLEAVRSEERR